MIIFWITGTSSNGISTPISPRATMIPSDTRMISSIFSTPCIFSILEIIFILSQPCSSKILRISNTSSAVLTKDAAIKSKSFSIPNMISARSCSLMYGMDRFTRGTFTPLRLDTGPPFTTRQTILFSDTCSTVISIRPSSISIVFPGFTSFTRFLYVIETIFSSPSTSSVVNVNVCPGFSSIFPFLKSFTRISGPFVSSSVATGRFSSVLNFMIRSMLRLCCA